jgi:hypothetical protein
MPGSHGLEPLLVTLMDAVQWQEITGEPPAGRPPSARTTARPACLVDYYAADLVVTARRHWLWPKV